MYGNVFRRGRRTPAPSRIVWVALALCAAAALAAWGAAPPPRALADPLSVSGQVGLVADFPDTPDAPSVSSLRPDGFDVAPQADVEYSLDGGDWTSSASFSGLEPGSTHSVKARWALTRAESESVQVDVPAAAASSPQAPGASAASAALAATGDAAPGAPLAALACFAALAAAAASRSRRLRTGALAAGAVLACALALPAAPAFAAATGWDEAASAAAPQADDIASGGFETDPNGSWVIRADGTLIISGTGTMQGGYSTYGPWDGYRDCVKSVTVEGDISCLNINNWFRDNHNLVSVSLPSTLLAHCTVFDGAFDGCTSLREFNLPSGAGSRDHTPNMNCMFRNCTSLEKVTLPNDLWDHDADTVKYMFKGCTSLKYLDLGDASFSPTDMTSMFEDCTSLVSLSFPSGFGERTGSMLNMFKGCTSLVSVDFPENYGARAETAAGMFSGCSHLQSVSLPSAFGQNVANFSTMFSGCAALGSLDLSRFDMRKAWTKAGMLDGCVSLSRIDLGPYCTFKGSDGNVSYTLPTPPSMYHSWQAVGSGTVAMPAGDSWANDVLAARYSQAMADTYVLSANMPGTPLDGNVGISGNLCAGNQLVAHVSGMQPDADPSFTWYVASDSSSPGVQVAEGSFYILQPADAGRYVYLVARDKSRAYAGFATSARSYVMSALPGAASVTGAFSVGTQLFASGPGIPDDARIACTWFSSSDALSQGVCVGTATTYTLTDKDFGAYIHVVLSDMSGKYGGSVSSTPQLVTYSGTFPSDADVSWTLTPDGTITFNGAGFVGDRYSTDVLPPWHVDAAMIKNAVFSGRVSYTWLDDWFCDCTQLQSVSFPNGFASSTQSMAGMFFGCSALSHVELPDGFGKSSSDVSSLFFGCSALQSIVLPKGFGENATNFTRMFFICSSLKTIDLSKANTLKATIMVDMMAACPALKRIVLGPSFSFKGGTGGILCQMPDLPVSYCSWQAVGQGTADRPMGAAWTASNLTSAYTGSMADTYVASMQLPVTRTSGTGDDGAGAAALLAAPVQSTAVSAGASSGAQSGYNSLLPSTDDVQGRTCLPAAELLLLGGSVALASSWTAMRRRFGFCAADGAGNRVCGRLVKAGDSKEGGSHVR